MNDARKTKPALIGELRRLRAKVKKIEKSGNRRLHAGKPAPTTARKNVTSKNLDIQGGSIKITHHKLAEEALRASNERFVTVFRASPVASVITRLKDSRLIEVNRAWMSMTGFSEAEALGHTSTELNIFVNVGVREEILQKLRDGEKVENFELLLRRKSGEIANALVSAELIEFGGDPCLLTLAQDITERRRAEQWLSESEERYRKLVEESPDAIAVQMKGVLIYVNPAAVKLIGAQCPEELIGKSIFDFIHPESREGAQTRLGQLASGQVMRMIDERLVRLDGAPILAEVTSIPTTYLGKLAVQIIVRDVTERKRAEETLRAASARIESILACVADTHILIDRQWRYVYVNEAAASSIGRPRDQILGRTLWDVFPDILGTELERQYRRAMDECVPIQFDFHYGTLDTWWDNRFYPSAEGLAVFASDITDRKRAEIGLAESEERYRGLVEGAPEAIALHSEGSIVYVNPAGAELFGAQSPEELIGKSILDFTHPENREGVLQRLEKMPPGHLVRLIDEKLIRLDGKSIYVDVTLIPTTVLGKPAVQVMIRDVTEHKLADRQLREAKEQYQQLVENINEVIFSLDDGGIITYVSPAISVIGGYTPAELRGRPFSDFVLPEDRTIANSGFERTIRGELGPSEFRMLTKSGHVRWIRSSSRPTVKQGNVAGISGVLIDITEDKWAKEGLALLGHTIRSIRECVSVTDSENNILFVNDAFVKTYGYTLAELIGKPISIVRSTTGSAAEDILKATLEGSWQGELVNRKKDGTEFPITLSTSIIRNDEGRLLGLVGIAADISERKWAEANLQQSLDWQEAIFEGSRDAIFIADSQDHFVAVNNAACNLTGYSREELLKMRIPDLHEKEDLAAYEKFRDRILAGEPILSEARIKRKDGLKVDTEFSNSRVIIAGITYMHATARNITDRKHAEEQLRQAKEKYQQLVENINEAIFSMDDGGIITYVSPAISVIGGYIPAELRGRHFRDFVLPDDLTIAYSGFQHVIRGELGPSEFRLVTKSGNVRWVRSSSKPIVKEGNVVGISGALTDITERKQAEEALQKSEERYRSLFANMLDGFAYCKMICDDQDRPVDFVYLAVNRAFEQLTGLKDVEGKRVSEVLPDVIESSPELIERYGRVALTGKPEQFEFNFRLLNQRLSISVYSTEKGYFVAVFENITERKLAEERHIISQEQLRHLAGHLQSVREEERKHLSQEFHDQLGQTLTALKMDLAMLQRELAGKTRDVSRSTLGEKIQSMQGLIDAGIQGIREIMSELHPELLDQLGLVAALEWEVERFQKRSGLQCRFTSELGEIPFDPKKSIALFRIFQEAVTNVVRHAQSTVVEINVRRESDDVVLEIKDNGVGIEPNAEHKARSFGLVGMRERAILLGGTLEITGIKGIGTTILVRMPSRQTQDDGGDAS